MSPEQLHGDVLTPASDLFSIGVVLYEALTGRLPYPDRPRGGEAPRNGQHGPTASTLAGGVPGRLDEGILQALRRDPSARFHSAEAWPVTLGAADEEVAPRSNETETQVVRAPHRFRLTVARAGVRERRASARTVPTRHRRSDSRRPKAREACARGRGRARNHPVLGAAALSSSSSSSPSRPSWLEGPAVAHRRPRRLRLRRRLGRGRARDDRARHGRRDRACDRGETSIGRFAAMTTRRSGGDHSPGAGGRHVGRTGSTFTMFSARISDCR